MIAIRVQQQESHQRIKKKFQILGTIFKMGGARTQVIGPEYKGGDDDA